MSSGTLKLSNARQRIEGMPADEYHAIVAASSSQLKKIRKSLGHMLAPREGSASFNLGTAVHSLVLEGEAAFRDRTMIRPKCFPDYRTKDSRAWRDEALANGFDILTHDEAALVVRVAKSVSQCDAAAALLEAAKPREAQRELTYLWHCSEFDVPCKCRLDAVAALPAASVAVDLKTTLSAHIDDFPRSCLKFGYDIQAAHYMEGHRVVEGVELAAWTIIAVENREPYGVAVYTLGPDWLELGEQKRVEALGHWADWYHDGRPDAGTVYPKHIRELPLPHWAAA